MSFVLSWNCGTSPTSPQSRYSASFVKACNWSHSNKTSASTNILNSWSPPSLSANFPNLSYEPPTYVCLWVNRTVRTSHVNKIIALFLHLYALVRLASGQTGCGHGDARTLLRRIKTTSLMPLKRVRGVHNVSRLLQCRYGQYRARKNGLQNVINTTQAGLDRLQCDRTGCRDYGTLQEVNFI